MKLIHLTALAAALGCALTTGTPAFAQANNDKDPLVPMDAGQVEVERIALMPSGWPDRATGVDVPMDLSGGNAVAQSMVNSGQVSPAAGAAGGILGALLVAAIDAGVDANRNSRIERMLEAHEFDASKIFEIALMEALTQGERTPVVQTADRPAKGFFAVTPKPTSNLDASVDVLISQYGFTLDGIEWRPSVSAQVKVYAPKSGALIMNEFLTYGRPSHTAFGEGTDPGGMTIIVPFDFRTGFKDVNAYVEDEPERAIEALTVGLQETAKAVARLVLVAAPDLADAPEVTEVIETVEAAADPVDPAADAL